MTNPVVSGKMPALHRRPRPDMIALACPVCGASLQREAACLRCSNNHSFDRARRGYVNLLPVQFRRSRQPGDDSGMVQARAQFLARGFYEPIRQQLIERIRQHLKAGHTHCLDIGCGEGYYTRAVASELPAAEVVALDISKSAIHAACHDRSSIEWYVASNAHLPVPDQSVDICWTLFTPLQTDELARTIKKDGVLIVVGAGENHLIELREKIYDEVRLKPFALPSTLDDWQRADHRLQFNFTVDNAALQQLLQMTPHFWRVAPAKKEPLLQLQEMTLTADIIFAVLNL
jgi:23S rRNA (guanine745-N1)-methyltransferase